jgi:hypothetical protein
MAEKGSGRKEDLLVVAERLIFFEAAQKCPDVRPLKS